MRTLLPLIALTTVAAPAFAAPQASEEVITVRINAADIDVATTEGRAALEARIDAKVRDACTVSKHSRYAYGRPVIDTQCIVNARAQALAQVEQLAASKQRADRKIAAN